MEGDRRDDRETCALFEFGDFFVVGVFAAVEAEFGEDELALICDGRIGFVFDRDVVAPFADATFES